MSANIVRSLSKSQPAEGFSTPFCAFDEFYFDSLIRGIGTALLQLFIEHSAPRFLEQNVDLKALLPVVEHLGMADLLAPQVSGCFEAISGRKPEHVERMVVGLLLYLGSRGLACEGNMELASPAVFLWDRFPLPPSKALSWKTDGASTATIEVEGGSFCFSRDAGGAWVSDSAEGFPWINMADHRVCLVSQFAGCTPAFLGTRFPVASCFTESSRNTFAEAFRILKVHAATYHIWIERLLRYIVLLEAPKEIMHSGSSEWLWGTVGISDYPDPLSICEMLVHECSHLYFTLATQQEPACSTKQEFYSPFVKRMRPLQKLMLGYHAFGNVYLFYQECMAVPELAAECAKRMERVWKEHLSIVQDLVTDPQYWTAAGKTLLSPVAERLRK